MQKFKTDRCNCYQCGGAGEPEFWSEERTPWAVKCWGCGLIYLSHHSYKAQVLRPDSRWACPMCGENASWNDENYSDYQDWFMEQMNDHITDCLAYLVVLGCPTMTKEEHSIGAQHMMGCLHRLENYFKKNPCGDLLESIQERERLNGMYAVENPELQRATVGLIVKIQARLNQIT